MEEEQKAEESPRPSFAVVPRPVPALSPTAPSKKQDETLSFYEALRYVVEQHGAVTKLEWNKPHIYMALSGDVVSIMGDDKLFHPLTLRDVDVIGQDWVKLNLR